MNLWRATDLALLADQLVQTLDEPIDGTDAPNAVRTRIAHLFQTTLILVPNPTVRAYLLQFLARSPRGASFQIKTPSIKSFIAELSSSPTASGASTPKLISFGAIRSALLFLLLDDPKTSRLPLALRTYLGAVPPLVTAPELRAFQVATHLASLFFRYGHESPKFVSSWATSNLEDWQRVLWDRLFALDGMLGKGWEWPAALGRAALTGAAALPRHLHVFGYTQFDATELQSLSLLAQHTSIKIYTVAPTLLSLPEQLDATASTLASWTHMHRQSLAALLDSNSSQHAGVAIDIKNLTAPADAAGATSVLASLQRAMHLHEDPQIRPQPDSSVKIMACHSIAREAEAVADEVWRLMVENQRAIDSTATQSPTLQPHKFSDVAVLVADRAKLPAYVAALRAAFAENHNIPLNLTGLAVADAGSVAEAVLALLALPGCGFARREMLAFLDHPAVCRRFGWEAGAWRKVCQAAGIFHGANHEGHADTYLTEDVYNWDQALRRLALGEFYARPAVGNHDGVATSDGVTDQRYFPIHGMLSPRMILAARALIQDVQHLIDMRGSLAAWGATLAMLVDHYIGDDRDDFAERTACAQALRELADTDATGGSLELSADVACTFAGSTVANSERRRGHRLAFGVHLAALAAGEPLPFRAIFICGLNHKSFAQPHAPAELDLRPREHCGPSPLDHDLAAFAEQIAAARERLVLSYCGWDSRGSRALPAAPVLQLKAFLKAHILAAPPHSTRSLVVKHPPCRYDEGVVLGSEATSVQLAAALVVSFAPSTSYELAAKRLRSAWDRDGVKPPTAAALAAMAPSLRDLLGTPYLPGATSTPGRLHALVPKEVSLAVLRNFLEEPINGWARAVLSFSQDDDGVDPRASLEPLAVDTMTSVVLLRDIFDTAVQGLAQGTQLNVVDMGETLRLRIQGLAAQGRGPSGAYAELTRRSMLDQLEIWASAFQELDLAKHGPFQRIRCGPAKSYSSGVVARESLTLEIPLDGGQGADEIKQMGVHGVCRIDLRGDVGIVSADESTLIYTSTNDKAPSDRTALMPFLACLTLAAARLDEQPKTYTIHVLGPKVYKGFGLTYTVKDLTPARARSQLVDLVHDLVLSSHAYRLPLYPAVNSRRYPNEDFLGHFAKNVDRYGNALLRLEDYEPPTLAVAEQMIERRLGLFINSILGSRR